MAMSPNCVDTEQIPSKMVAGDREILGIGENPKSFGESRLTTHDGVSAARRTLAIVGISGLTTLPTRPKSLRAVR